MDTAGNILIKVTIFFLIMQTLIFRLKVKFFHGPGIFENKFSTISNKL